MDKLVEHPVSQTYKRNDTGISFVRRGGFALVLSLVLMAFLLMLMVSLATLLQVEVMASKVHQDASEARQNALLGLQIALGQLQESAGPDMRATATAAILAGTLDERRHWTGVWVASGAGAQGDPTPPRAEMGGEPFRRYQPPLFRSWLVSGVDTSAGEAAAGSAGALQTPVKLVGSGSVSAADDHVEAGRVSLDGAVDSGGYAYWVSDEGVKAKLNISGYDPLELSGTGGNRALVASPRSGIEFIQGEGTGDDSGKLGDWFNPWLPGSPSVLARTSGLFSFPLVAPEETGLLNLIRERYHDITFHSYGLPVNAYRGGLRKDLSLAFEMDLNTFNDDPLWAALPGPEGEGAELSHPVNFLFHLREFGESLPAEQRTWSGKEPMPDRAGNPATIFGPTWHLLRNYYRLYKPVDADRNVYGSGLADRGVHLDSGTPRIKAQEALPRYSVTQAQYYLYGHFDPFSTVRSNLNDSSQIPLPMFRATHMAVSPVPVRARLVLSLSAELTNGDAIAVDPNIEAVYRLHMHVDPIVNLWNPYNARMEIANRFDLNWLWPKISGILTATYPDGSKDDFDISMVGAGRTEEGGGSIGHGSDTLGGMNISLRISADGKVAGGLFTLEPGEVKLYSSHPGVETGNTGTSTASGFTTVTYPLYAKEGIGNLADEGGLKFDKIHITQYQEEEVREDGTVEVIQLIRGEPIEVPAGTEISLKVTADNTHRSVLLRGDMGPTSGMRLVWYGHFFFIDDYYSQAAFSWPSDTPGDFLLVEDLDNWGSSAPNKTPVAVVDVSLKAEDADFPVPFISQYAPRASVAPRPYGRDMELYDVPASGATNRNTSGNYQPRMWRVTEWNDLLLALTPDNQAPIGESNEGGINYHMALHELPTEPLLSVTELRHAGSGIISQQPAYMIGESWANAFVPKTGLVYFHYLSAPDHGYSNHRHRSMVDWNYLMNDAVYDGFFFSGMAPDGSRGLDEVLEDFASGSDTLLNPRMRLNPYRDEDLLADLTTSGGDLADDAYRKSAAHLLIDGVFNVNSTSIEAWVALLSGLNRIRVNSVGGEGDSDVENPFSRLRRPSALGLDRWNSYVSLTENEVRTLARRIVVEIRERGPFVSLSDFVNRRLADDETGEMGALQAAIEATGINSGFTRAIGQADLSHANAPNANSLDGRKVAAAATGYLTQGDLLTPLAPFLNVRSDTFKIRAYGDKKNPLTGETVARAWCEAVVQRMPDFVDTQANEPWDDYTELSSNGTNQRLGRQYQIVSFRWLKEDEV